MKDKPGDYWTPANLEKIAATFDERWYAATYWRDLGELKQPSEHPLDFYLRIGGRVGHDPHRNFSELFFRTFNANVYAHLRLFPKDFGYLLFVDESRNKFRAAVVATASQCEQWRLLVVAVDRQFVAARHSIDEKKYVSALDYYVRCSRRRPISPSRSFSEEYYRSANPDVNAMIRRGDLVSGYQHFRIYGIKQARQVFSVQQFERDWAAVGVGLLAFNRRLSNLKNFLVGNPNRFLFAI